MSETQRFIKHGQEGRRDLAVPPDAFRRLGHRLIDRIADHLADMPAGRVKPHETAESVWAALDAHRAAPHFKELGRKLGDYLAGRPDVQVVQEV